MLALAAAWHERVIADEVVSHAFEHGFRPDHTERLAADWAEALGGPPAFSGTHGDETSVVRMHSGNGRHDEMDRRAIACFDQASSTSASASGPSSPGCSETTSPGLPRRRWTATPGSAEDVPDGLTNPQWS